MTGILKWKDFKRAAPLLALAFAAISISLVSYLRAAFIFETNTLPAIVEYSSIVAATLALFFAFLSFPKWQGFIAIAVALYVMYSVLFTPLYAFASS